MKLFLGILLAATIAGGFAGGEILDTSFSIMGALIGGVGTAAVLLGLGAYFESQAKKSPELPPEMRGVFDRMITGKENPTRQEIQAAKQTYLKAAQTPNSINAKSQNKRFSIEGAIQSLMEQDAEAIAHGEIPEKRLIPHHAIKRDMIIAAYTKDSQVAEKQVMELSWSEDQKSRQLAEIRKDFEKKIYGIRRLSWQELDEIISLMKKTRTDLKDIEKAIRSQNPLYKIVEPLCA